MNETSIGEEGKIRIMIVEDDVDVGESIRDYLFLEDFDAVTYDESPKALKELEKGNYHLVLLDLRMPNMSGQVMLKKMRERDWTIPVIIITAYPSKESAIESLKLQASDYIEKPFEMSRLLKAINIVIEERGIIVHRESGLTRKVGERIKSLRYEKKITLRQLATRAGVSPSLLSKVEAGRILPALPIISKVAKSLQVDLGVFFEDIES